jgi:hypothetical protein
VQWLADGAALEQGAGGGLETAVENLGVEVDVTRPLDGVGLRIDSDLFEELAILNGSEDPAAGKQPAEVDLLDSAIGEGGANLEALKRFDLGYLGYLAHRSGSIGRGC